LLSISVLSAQELNCVVSVDATRLQTDQATEKSIFPNLEKAITTFINSKEWTSDDFKKNEQINCRLLITVTKSPVQNVFEATAQIVSSRPVYGTTYETLLLNFNDKNFNFRYVADQPMIFNDNNFTDNLTSMIAYYMYAVLALDYDSFSKLGGNSYIEKMFNVANIAQSSNELGWNKTTNTINRYWLAENLQSQQMIPFRESIYTYHRLALDTYLTNGEEARKKMLECIEIMTQINKVKPSSALFNVYFDAKNVELVNIFKEATPEIKKKFRDMVVLIDPANASKYDRVMEN
jgi:Domain of unknown function (DUF4835)